MEFLRKSALPLWASTITFALTFFAISSIGPNLNTFEKIIPWTLSILMLGTIIIIEKTRKEKKDNPHDWEKLQAISSSKIIIIPSLFFTLLPIALKAIQATNQDISIPFIAYMYWACGLCLFIYIPLYKILCPPAYRYNSLKEITEKHGGTYFLRTEAEELINKTSHQKDTFSESDTWTLHLIARGLPVPPSEAFYVVRARSADTRPWQRLILSILLYIPAFLAPTTIATNIILVGAEAITKANQLGGLSKAIYGPIIAFFSK